ncbi:MAG: CARDB domain-containing protein [Acidimicrobiia bacterium]
MQPAVLDRKLERRLRRRRWAWWPVLLTIIVLLALILARINAQASAAVAYLDGIRQSAEHLVTAASTFSNLPDDLAGLDRAEFETASDSVAAALNNASASVLEAPQRSSLVGAASLFRLAVSTWIGGVRTFQEGMLRSADLEGAGEEQIYAGIQQVAAGDQLYRGVLTELARAEVPDPITPLPELQFHSPDYSPVALARLFAAAAAADNSLLALRADLAVGQVTSQPAWVTDPDGDLVVEPVESIRIDVVVANLGNTSAPIQNLFLDLSTDEEEDSRTLAVPALAPGAQTTVSFLELAVASGQTYQLSVALQLTEPDGNADNDGIALSFFVNEPVE